MDGWREKDEEKKRKVSLICLGTYHPLGFHLMTKYLITGWRERAGGQARWQWRSANNKDGKHHVSHRLSLQIDDRARIIENEMRDWNKAAGTDSGWGEAGQMKQKEGIDNRIRLLQGIIRLSYTAICFGDWCREQASGSCTKCTIIGMNEVKQHYITFLQNIQDNTI